MKKVEAPLPAEVSAAKANPGGWVYRIAGGFGPNDSVPPEAIVGAWKVDARTGSGSLISGTRVGFTFLIAGTDQTRLTYMEIHDALCFAE